MGGGSPLKKWLALLPAFLWLAFLRLGELPPGNENSADAYYHVQMARLFPHAAMADQFPWTTLSIWENTFYDKELLFHGVVKVLDRLGRALGFSSEPPFHFTALALTAWVLATIWSVARSFRIPAPGWMLFALAALCPFFSHRMVELRPHLVSIALMVAFCGWARTYRRTEDLAIACGFGFVMAYAYSNPHFLLLPAVAFAIAIFPENRRLASLLPAAVLVGILVGLTFHPQFPNTFRLWKIQCVDVLRESFSGSRRVFLGGELYRPDALWLVRNGAIFIALAASVGIFEALRRKRFKFSRETLAMFLLQIVSTLPVFISMRALEYAVPFSVLGLGLLIRDARAAKLLKIPKRAAYGWAFAGLLAIAGWNFIYYSSANLRNFAPFAKWAKTHVKEGEVVANPNWSDFPMLFYAAPQYRFSLGMDPMFAYRRDPVRIAKLEAFRTGQAQLKPAELRGLVQARWIFVSLYAWQLARDLNSQGYALAYQGPDGWVFDLGPR